MDGFVHLHVHSHYSLLDGGNRIKDLVETAQSHGMSSLAITDHGNLFGAVEFHHAATSAGIKPILGMEAYISPTTRDDRSMGNITDSSYHMILLAMNETGWRNLMKLSSRAYLEGFYYRPRIDRELLAEFNEGLICTTACLGGEVPSALLSNKPDKARQYASEYLDIFGRDRFFIEIQNQLLPEQDQVNPELVRIAGELGVGIVGTNDVHFLKRENKRAHEVLTCISTGKTLDSGGAMKYSAELYLKNASEMRQAMSQWPKAADNTLKIAGMCDVKLDFNSKYLPIFHAPDGSKPEEYLRKLAWEGLTNRFSGKVIPEDYKKRLEWELKVIEDKGYSSYFLIVNDFVQFARQNNIPSAPRGSGVATLLGYSLGIADVDPIRYGLLFERFTDPARKEAPDIDIDICQEGRAKVIQYVREKYGHVAQIITYGTLKARAAIRDVGRVLDIPLPQVDSIAKLVTEGPKVTLEKALDAEPDLKAMYDSDQRIQQVIDFAQDLEGLARHSGVHAAGVVVAEIPLENVVPLCRQSDSEGAITQWDGETCDKIGLMKMDFLGLRTLTIIQRARELVLANTGKDVDPEKIPLDDPRVFELFQTGHTDGVFQFESDGMKNVLIQMQPSRLEDLIAANAMYRPGPMELIPSYCSRKKGDEKIPSVHELVDDILAETYGIMCYQEQVMQVVNRLGKIPLNRALTLIKAIGKKKHKVIESEKPHFISGAEASGINREDAEELFELILKFAGYGFNKAHSTRYAIVAYQTAYFKAHFPREFLAATLTFESGDTDKIVQYMTEAGRMGVTIAPPDINACSSDFTVDGELVRFGLAAVKGVGARAVEAIAAARNQGGPFEDLYDFCKRIEPGLVNRSTIEALIKCGAFDSLGAHRAAMIKAIDDAIGIGQTAAADRKSGQMNFFGEGVFAEEETKARFPDVEPWSESQLLAAEKETLGFYVTSHPLVKFGREITSLSTPTGISLAALDKYGDGTAVTVGTMIASIRPTFTKKDNKKMAMLTLEDLTGKCDAVVFPKTYDNVYGLLQPDAMVFIQGTLDWRRERPSIIVEEVIPLKLAVKELTGSMLVRLGGNDEVFVNALKALLKQYSGNCPVFLEIRPHKHAGVCTTIRPGKEWFVSPNQELVEKLEELLDQQNLVLKPKKMNTNNSSGNGRYSRNGRRSFRQRQGQASGDVSEAVTRFN